MNWNSIVRAAAACAMYVALMGAYFADVGALGFALLSALVLSLGLCVHSIEPGSSLNKQVVHSDSVKSSGGSPAVALVPSLTESMTQLHKLQTEINELQAQFALDTESRTRPFIPDGSDNS